jgi:molecular chaperone DnaK
MPAVGFDFGTTNSLISVIQGNRAVSLLDDQGLPIPSVVCYEGAQTIVGREAHDRLGQAGLGVHGNVVRSPKTLLGRESVFVGGVERNPVDIVHQVVSFVRRKALETKTIKNIEANRAVVTIPVRMEGRRRAMLRDAFHMAGMTVIQFVHEPLAALYAYLRSSDDFAAVLRRFDAQLMLVFDWGGGTLDLTLCRLIDGHLVQIGNDGTDEVGGDWFDEELKNEVERRVRDARALAENVGVQSDARTRLLHACERAKIDLSLRSRVSIYVPNFFRGLDDPDLDLALTREDLDSVVAHLVSHGLQRIERLLDREGYSTNSVSMCLATGGMANMPSVKARLHELFGPSRVHVSERSASLIAEGAAWIAHDDARLHLAKNVELVLARNSFMPLLPAGFEMPQEGEVRGQDFGLYCVDPSDGFGKFELVAPHRPGPKVLPDDMRRPLVNLMVPVDRKAAPFRERLQLDVAIDENLILTARARSLNQRGLAEREVHDLEFALALPTGRRGWLGADQFEVTSGEGPIPTKGSLVMRSNIAAVEDNRLVPGEVLYRHDPLYFDVRRSPLQIQVDEMLYYEPCTYCARPSNDPLCRCASMPSAQNPRSTATKHAPDQRDTPAAPS